MDDLMIRVSHVSKEYKLGQIGGTTLREELQRKKAKLLKREDPTAKIGQKAIEYGKKFLALDNVSLDVKPGEAVGIIGRNGAGKSTLLKLLSRVTAPTSGEIGLNGRIASMLEVGTGFHPELTGRENIYMNGAILGMTKREIDSKLDEIIDFSEVRKFIDTPVKRYSSGMYVKLAFSVAAHLDSEIMIMDEVLAVGDVAFQQKCINKMRHAAKREGKTVLYVSHNMNTIRQLCDRCIVLDHGHKIFDGEVEEAIQLYLHHNYRFTNVFDYKDLPRSINEKRNLQLLTLELPDRESSVISYETRDSIKIKLTCRANDEVHHLKFRFEIMYSDLTIAGALLSDKFINAHKGDIVTASGTLNFSNLMPGEYTAAILIYDFNEYGQEIGIDRVYPGFIFKIEESKDESELHWLHQYWGHVRLNDFVIDEIKIGG